MAFCHAVTQGQQGWSSYGLVQPTIPHQWKRRYHCMDWHALESPPKTSFGCRKGGAFLHGSTPCWCRQTCEPSEWVSEEYVCASMQDGWSKRFSNCFSRDAGLVSTSTVFLCESPSRTYRACPAKIGEFMRHLLRVIGWRVCCSPCAHHLACKKSNNAPGVCSIRCGPASPTGSPDPTLLSWQHFAHDMPRSASAVNIRNS